MADADAGERKKKNVFTRCMLRIKAYQMSPKQKLHATSVAIQVISALQIVIAVSIFFVGYYQSKNETERFTALFSGSVGFVSPLAAFYGILANQRDVVRLYFVMQMWVLSIVTSYMYETIESGRVEEAVCAPSLENYGAIDSRCDTVLMTSRGKIVMAVFASLFSVTSALLSLEFADVSSEVEAGKGGGEGDSKANRAHRLNLLATTVQQANPHHLGRRESIQEGMARRRSTASNELGGRFDIANEGGMDEEEMRAVQPSPENGAVDEHEHAGARHDYSEASDGEAAISPVGSPHGELTTPQSAHSPTTLLRPVPSSSSEQPE